MALTIGRWREHSRIIFFTKLGIAALRNEPKRDEKEILTKNTTLGSSRSSWTSSTSPAGLVVHRRWNVSITRFFQNIQQSNRIIGANQLLLSF